MPVMVDAVLVYLSDPLSVPSLSVGEDIGEVLALPTMVEFSMTYVVCANPSLSANVVRG